MIPLQNLHLMDKNIKPNSKVVACSGLPVSKTESDIKELRTIQTYWALANIIASSWFWSKIDFSEEKCHWKCLIERFWASRFQNFLGGGEGHAPRPPLAARAFRAGTCLVLFWSLAMALTYLHFRPHPSFSLFFRFTKTILLSILLQRSV